MRPSTCGSNMWPQHMSAVANPPPQLQPLLCKLCCSFPLQQHITSALTQLWTGLKMDVLYGQPGYIEYIIFN